MTTFLRRLLRSALALLILVATLWAALALWYRLPAPDALRGAAAAGFALIGAFALLGLARSGKRRSLALFCATLAAVVVWWSTLTPPQTRNWSPDVARQVTGQIDGDTLTLTDVRNFRWRAADDFDPVWENRQYDLATLETVDLFMSYWSGPWMAHMIVSFGFADGDYIAWSVEVRREQGGGFSPVADQFKTNTLVLVAADERDVLATRTNVRGEDVQLFRIDTPPETARALLLQYVAAANDLAAQPTWYNSLFTNCTTVVLQMIATLTDGLPFDWRVVANGYLPEYAYDQGVLDSRLTMAQLRAAGQITARARAYGMGPEYSAEIRKSVPSPLQ